MVTQRNPVMGGGGREETETKTKTLLRRTSCVPQAAVSSSSCLLSHKSSSFLPTHDFLSYVFTHHGLRANESKHIYAPLHLRDTHSCAHTAEVCNKLYYAGCERKTFTQ